MADLRQNFSIIVPAHNEAKTIGHVLDVLLQTQAKEIVVIDDGSTDNTRKIALSTKDSRVKCISHSQNLGQGNAWKTGIRNSNSPILVFFDADIESAQPEMISNLINPIVDDYADLVMGGFENFGRITEYLVRPLLRRFIPELSKLSQPLSGLFAIRREFIFPEKIGNRYVTIGVLIDAYLAGARVKEAELGYVKHDKRTDQEKAAQAESECEILFKKLVEYKVVKLTPLPVKISPSKEYANSGRI
ncbi:MAG: Glycosyl transferase family 2 [Candidatus Amesbacteria bacterium GW2011_GWB1_47_26]|uniref:Glycosyl transferase family 2 n=1 Tax=Candidatus Amesbacteria bacterium GW2011_GWC2_45_19 TaxID=1618366 RepID=A0A0G1PCR2_9BACT|nr:MAG: Glycosyl transferase family 2 [Candidatus Amesbacteria bacterium GW2011_GWC2_45_19]KKU38652.1 MAG: Glycosyl transferase family 2 [Candidatus Amesbacteria bacterium GW2011_GWA1_46_35]KKU68643.1 MAG: Glycosyl transferase family 2 [Microgenomates group bacterium GW2011_GWC1_47_20]KKU74972.1 MAG: Glycosyl transferase family 2 [Candidatus Amesbacteria bacterium GW2011_GWB1_47_26]KKU79016.1 MAG: Glycosyl transferase family 2 [Candidatus Amesbacteria bacterium GW2011_GWA2_47_70]